MADRSILRIVDANSNRTREALRVVEDIVRFSLEDKGLATSLKDERHRIARYCDSLLKQHMKGLKARDTRTDPGRDSMSRSEATRRNLGELLVSNFRRAEESLRVLEEVTKLVDVRLPRMLKRSRFRVYELEKTCMIRMERRLAKD
jgi:thiamine-phosphate pyrophosphorylase